MGAPGRINLAQAVKKNKAQWADIAGVDCTKTGVGEDSCSETESESESKSKDEKYVPIPHGTRSPRVVPSEAVDELVRRVYGTAEGDTPIIICDIEVEAVGIVMTQLTLKQGLKRGESKLRQVQSKK